MPPSSRLTRISDYGLSAPALRFLETQGQEVRLRAGEHALVEGERVEHFWWVREGICRIYRVDSEGSETTKSFSVPGQLCAPYAELLEKSPSRSFVQALSPVRALRLPVAPFQKLAETELEWALVLRKIAELSFLEKENREHEFLTLSASDRYARVVQEAPELFQTVPLRIIASYLGITPVALSRIRARRK